MANFDKALTRLTKMQMHLGLFDSKKRQPYFNYGIDMIDSAAHKLLALEASHQAIVLLKNSEKHLPLTAGKHIAVIGPHMNSTEALISNYHGSRCVDNTFNCIETPLAAITKANKGGTTMGVMGCDIASTNTNGIAAAGTAAKAADTIVLVVGIDQTQEREGLDRVISTLPGVQTQLIMNILALHKPTVLVLIHGGTMSLGPIKDAASTIVDAFYGGEMASVALADVLFGNVNPSARMAATMYPPNYVDQLPLTQMAMKVAPGRTHLYYTGTPEFKFGDGLSYSTFETSLIGTPVTTIDTGSTKTKTTFKLQVKNVAGPPGKHTVLAFWKPSLTTKESNVALSYIQQKMFDYNSVVVAPTQSSTMKFTLDLTTFSVAEENGDQYINPGEYEIFFYDGMTQVVKVVINLVGEKTLTQTYSF